MVVELPKKRATSSQHSSKVTKLTLTVTEELKDEIIKRAKENFGDRRGVISWFVEMELRKTLNMQLPGVTET